MRERRLGSLMRHEHWHYAELLSVTLLLIWWSAMFRALWVYFMLTQSGDADLGWLEPGAGGPSILASLAIIEILLLAMTAGCYLDARNRTRLGFGIGTFNLAFVVALGGATLLQGAFASETAAHRASGSPSEWNLSRALAGDWEVVDRLEPDGAPRFPGRGMKVPVLGVGSPRVVLQEPTPDLVEAWARLESTAAFVPRTKLFEKLISLLPTSHEVPELLAPSGRFAQGPALEIEVIRKPELRELPWGDYCVWVGQVSEANVDRLELRHRFIDGRREIPDARVSLRRVHRVEAGWDVGDELSRARSLGW